MNGGLTEAQAERQAYLQILNGISEDYGIKIPENKLNELKNNEDIIEQAKKMVKNDNNIKPKSIKDVRESVNNSSEFTGGGGF